MAVIKKLKAVKIKQNHLLGIQDLSFSEITYILEEAKTFIKLNKSTSKKLEQVFRESLIIELEWENKIEYIISDSIKNYNFQKISFLKLIRKYFSKRIRMLFK